MSDPKLNKNQNPTEVKSVKATMEKVSGFWADLIDLKKGVDKYATIKEIQEKKSMNGANAWMLMCSIMIASIGLNLNSQAVIIGAMLISPLMSPILGIGLSVAINDMATLRKCLRHFGAAVLIAVVTSFIFFFFSPLAEVTEQIRDRTAPSLYDVLIGIFGGIAGIISIARKDISTTLPGVAIATALMPPLCVTGFGIANGLWQFALSSFYLFFLNTFFVSLATYLIIRYLQFPYRKYVNPKEKRRNMIYIVVFTLITMIPSVWIFMNVIKESRTATHINNFIEEYIGDDRVFLDGYQYIQGEDSSRLVLKVYGDKISTVNMAYYQEGLSKHDLSTVKLEIMTTSEVKLEKLAQLESRVDGIKAVTANLAAVKEEQNEQEVLLNRLEDELQSLELDSLQFQNITQEMKILFPNLKSFSFALGQQTNFEKTKNKVPILLLDWNQRSSKATIKKAGDFIKTRLDLDTIVIR